MKPFGGPKPKLEKEHYADLRKLMVSRGWMVKKVTASAYMLGWPDVFAAHKEFGVRWIETKRPDTGRLSADQVRVFTEFQTHGVGIWILETAMDYNLLFGRPNWWQYTVKEFRPH